MKVEEKRGYRVHAYTFGVYIYKSTDGWIPNEEGGKGIGFVCLTLRGWLFGDIMVGLVFVVWGNSEDGGGDQNGNGAKRRGGESRALYVDELLRYRWWC